MNKPVRVFIALLFLAALFACTLALFRNGVYGLTLFVPVPVTRQSGAVGAWAVRPVSAKEAALAGTLTTVMAVCSLLALGVEGALCIADGFAPWPFLWVLLAVCWPAKPSLRDSRWAVSRCNTAAARRRDVGHQGPSARIRGSHRHRNCRDARAGLETRRDIFKELPEPREWYFRAGLAYPQRAPHCPDPASARSVTASSRQARLAEPIEVWSEPRLLRFRVTSNPAPLREWSPYGNLTPKHLHGYLVSEGGQFQLTPLANGHTLLEGTTWYRHGLWPAQYWRWWSDAIVHRIHLRVLNHIRTLAEEDASWSNLSK